MSIVLKKERLFVIVWINLMKKQHVHMTTLITAILTREYDKSNCYTLLNMITKNKDESAWGILYLNLMTFSDPFGSVYIQHWVCMIVISDYRIPGQFPYLLTCSGVLPSMKSRTISIMLIIDTNIIKNGKTRIF